MTNNISLKILGLIDLASAFAFLLLVFGVDVSFQYLLFCAGLISLKGMFILSGDILSVIDILSAIILLLAIFFSMPIILLWVPAFLLIAKGVVSFI